MTGQAVRRAWLLTVTFWLVAVAANLVLMLTDEDIRALLIVRGLAAALMLTGLALSSVLTVWWLLARGARR